MSLLPFFTIPVRFLIATVLTLFIMPFMAIYLMFYPKEGWADLKFMLFDARDFVLEGKRDRFFEDCDNHEDR